MTTDTDTTIPPFLKRAQEFVAKGKAAQEACAKVIEDHNAKEKAKATIAKTQAEEKAADKKPKKPAKPKAKPVPKKAGKLVAKAVQERDALAAKAKAAAANSAPKAKTAEKPKKKSASNGGKTETVIARLKKGVTMKELEKVTGWSAHSVRAFISGTLRGKMKLKVNAEKNKDGTYVYSTK